MRAIIPGQDGRVLSLKRAPDGAGAGMWSLPGGKAEYAETVEDAVRREIREETLLEPVECRFLFYEDSIPLVPDGAHCLNLYFECRVTGDPALGDEAAAWMWVGPGDLHHLPVAFRNDEGLLRYWREVGVLSERDGPVAERSLRLSGKALLRDGQGRFLLLRRSLKSVGNPGKWDLPGGKVDEGESVWEALAREVREECGLQVRIEGLVGSVQSDTPDRRIVYLVMEAAALDTDVRLSDEHEDFGWFTRSELAEVDIAPQFREVVTQFASATG